MRRIYILDSHKSFSRKIIWLPLRATEKQKLYTIHNTLNIKNLISTLICNMKKITMYLYKEEGGRKSKLGESQNVGVLLTY